MMDVNEILDLEDCEKKERTPNSYVGKKVTRSAIVNDDPEPTIECGVIVSAWNDNGEIDCYIAFFGTSFPIPEDGNPKKPYILRYYLATLNVLDETRPAEYNEWVETNVGEDRGYGRCTEICEAMQKTFPHLELRKGVYHSLSWGERPHWWLHDPILNQIVDPTYSQHPDGELLPLLDDQYQDMTKWTDDGIMDVVPSGKCKDCGEPVYHHKNFCSDQCSIAFMAHLNAPAF